MNQVVHLMYPTNRHDIYIMNYVECFCETGLHVSQPAMAVWRSQHAQYHHPDTEAAKGNSGITHFILYTPAFPTVT